MQRVKVFGWEANVGFCEGLGFRVERRDDGWRWPMLRRGDCRLMVDESIRVQPGLSPGSVIYLQPDDMSEYHRPVRENGLAVPDLEVTFIGVTEFRIDDPDGNRRWIGKQTSTGS